MVVSDDDAANAAFNRELAVLARLRHSRVILLLGTADNESSGEMWLLMPLYEHGNLRKLLSSNLDVDSPLAGLFNASRKSRIEACLRLGRDIMCGLSYLASKNIVHGDLKSSNVLIGDDLHAVITDFGMSRIIRSANSAGGRGSTSVGGGGTVAWMAPEVIRGGRASFASDVYAAGIILWEILTGFFAVGGH